MTKIKLISDLHLIEPDFDMEIESDTDILVIAGDVSDSRKTTVAWIKRIAAKNPLIQVLFVPGNHDHFGGEYFENVSHFREMLSDFINAHFLDNEIYIFSEKKTGKQIAFLGSTFWADFEGKGKEEAAWSIRSAMVLKDFQDIKFGDKTLDPSDARSLCIESRHWLEEALKETKGMKQVVITHFPLHPKCNETENDLSPYFANDHANLLAAYRPALALSGHTHTNVDFVCNETRFVSNQNGFQHEDTGYNPNLILEI